MLSEDEARDLHTEYILVCSELRDVTYKIVDLVSKLKTDNAKKYCQYGLARRVMHLRKSVEYFSSVLHEEISENEISSEVRFQQTAYLNYFFLCISGGLDNLARIVAYENNLVLDDNQISIHNKRIREVMPALLRTKIDEHIDWLNEHIKGFRDPIAHRISPYVVPEVRFDDGTKTSLSHYVHDFDSSPFVPMHPQVIRDVRAFIDLCVSGVEGILQSMLQIETTPLVIKNESLQALIDIEIANLSSEEALAHIAILVDSAHDYQCQVTILHAQKLIEEIKVRTLSETQILELQYFHANSWNLINQIKNREESESFAWEKPEFEKEIILLRTIVKNKNFKMLSPYRQVQVKTNLANKLSEIGRPISALRMYDSVLKLAKNFGMALGGKGICAHKYAMHLYDEGHEYVISCHAYKWLSEAAVSRTTDVHAKQYFDWYLSGFNKELLKLRKIPLDKKDLGRSQKEQSYRQWCVKAGLFLNPLNDLGAHSLAYRDVFGMPPMTTKISEGANPPKFFGYYNVLKQEYVSARYLFFEGLSQTKEHFSDRNVLIYNTLDYPAHSLAIERIKTAYRVAYSLLDKIAFFLRDYFEISIGDDRVYFKSIWYNNADRQRGLRKVFAESENLPLRGLFWLSKDLFEKSGEFKDSIEPEAEYLYDIRNSMEHRFFSTHQMRTDFEGEERKKFKLEIEELESKTMGVFRIAREALMYLSLAIHREEVRRCESGDLGAMASMEVTVFEDKWKRRF